MKPLRIIHTEAATSFGGQEHRIFKEMLAMRERGHYLEAVCQPHAQLTDRLRKEGFVVHTMLMDGPLNYMKCVARLAPVFRRGRFDVINTHSRRDAVIGASAGRLARVPLLVRTRHLANKIGSLFSYTVLPNRVVTVSDHVRGLLLAKGVDPDHVATVYSPIQLPPVVEHSTLRSELKLAENDIVIGCVAVMRAKKGHRSLIDAAEPLIRERPNVHMVFVGGGSPTFEEVQSYIAQKGLSKRVHLLGMRRDVPNLLAGFDIFALATEQEASGTVFVEAAAAGLPVIGTDVGGVSEMMLPDETGLLVPVHNQQALHDALRTLVLDEPLRRRLGRAGLKWVREDGRFSLDRLVNDTEQCYYRWLEQLR